LSSLLTVATTRAPPQRASSIAARPTAPAPPATRTVRPSIGPSAKTHRCAVMTGMPRLAPMSAETPSGSATARLSGTTVYWAAVPHGRCQAAKYTHTRAPMRARSTPSPTSSMTPAPSWFGIWNGDAMRSGRLARAFQSVGLTPETDTRTSTSPGPGSGRCTSVTWRTERAGPGRL
jgi:hypothetical protein